MEIQLSTTGLSPGSQLSIKFTDESGTNYVLEQVSGNIFKASPATEKVSFNKKLAMTVKEKLTRKVYVLPMLFMSNSIKMTR